MKGKNQERIYELQEQTEHALKKNIFSLSVFHFLETLVGDLKWRDFFKR